MIDGYNTRSAEQSIIKVSTCISNKEKPDEMHQNFDNQTHQGGNEMIPWTHFKVRVGGHHFQSLTLDII